jgi:hypothetical protein
MTRVAAAYSVILSAAKDLARLRAFRAAANVHNAKL